MTEMTMRCSECGSPDVMRDAWAVWDDAMQEWVLGTVFDAGFCDHCGEVSITEVDIAASGHRIGAGDERFSGAPLDEARPL